MKRADQRRYAILGALHEHGELNSTQLARILHLSPGYIYVYLMQLEEQQGLIVHRMAMKDGDTARRMYWRITNNEQRRDHSRRRLEEVEKQPLPWRRMPQGAVWQPGGAS